MRSGPGLTLELGMGLHLGMGQHQWLVDWCEAAERRLAEGDEKGQSVLSNLADIVSADRRAILYPAVLGAAIAAVLGAAIAGVLGAAIAGVFGSAVAKRLRPCERPPAK